MNPVNQVQVLSGCKYSIGLDHWTAQGLPELSSLDSTTVIIIIIIIIIIIMHKKFVHAQYVINML